MAAYAIANIRITDPDRFPEYASAVPQTIERYGGRYLARGGDVEVLEGEWEPQRLVILEFESVERLREWYDSPEYAPLKRLREEVAASQLVVVVEGL
jgi:uncharacterized protein (DUF1330 family)